MTNIEEIRERCEKATPGPWKQKETDDYSEIHDANSWGKALSPLALVGSRQEDADFIAHAREDIPFLLAEVTRLTAERDAAVSYIRDIALPGIKCRACKWLCHTEPNNDFCLAWSACNQGDKWEWRGVEGKEEPHAD